MNKSDADISEMNLAVVQEALDMLLLESVFLKVSSNRHILHSLNHFSWVPLGLRVFATARNRDTLHDLAARGIETLSLEVDRPQSVRDAKAEVERLTGGRLEILINNA